MLNWGIRQRVEEDLERMKSAEANTELPEDSLELELLDYPAIIIGFMLALLPYLAIFLGVMFAAVAFMYLWLR